MSQKSTSVVGLGCTLGIPSSAKAKQKTSMRFMVSWRPPPLGGAIVSGSNGPYDAVSSGTDHVAVLRDTKMIGSTMVSGALISYTRLSSLLAVPKGGVGLSLADQGISNGPEGLQQGAPPFAGVETLCFSSFIVGANPLFLDQVNNKYQAGNNFSKVSGKHALKFGGQYIGYRLLQLPDLVANGTYSLFGSGTQFTGNGYGDLQWSSPLHESAADGRVFGEDSRRIKNNLILNLGVRWDYVTPWLELHDQITALVPGVQFQTFPVAPLGYRVAGDHLTNGQADPSGIAPAAKDNFSPRFRIADSPNWFGGFLEQADRRPGKTGVYLGGGRFFAFPEGYPRGNTPYGLTYTSAEPPVMATPFIGAMNGTQYIQQFPVDVASLHRVGDRSRHDRELVAVHTRQRCGQRLVPEQDRLHHVVELKRQSATRIEHAG